MDFTITGTIKKILEVEKGTSKATGKEWQKQLFVVSNNEGYENREQIFCFEVFGEDKVSKLTQYNKEGDNVTVHFNISTNEWNGKYFTSLGAWKVMKADRGEIKSPVNTDDENDEPLPF
jgi:hypothetical protein